MGADQAPSKKGKGPKESKTGRKLVKSGKDQGRLTDMGEIALKEAEEIKKKEKELGKDTVKKAKKSAKAAAKPKKQPRSQRYLAAKKQVDRQKDYPISEAIKLVKKTSISKFEGKIELHLNIKEKGLKRQVALPFPVNKEKKLTITSEKKFPLVHLIIGKAETKNQALAENFEAILKTIGRNNIQKAVLTSTMGPGIKVIIDKQ